MTPLDAAGPPTLFAPYVDLFPTAGMALEIACGRGWGAVWLATRGMKVHGVDVSPVAIELARELVLSSGVADTCSFEVHDLDDGLPDGPRMDLIFCYLFRDHRLDSALMDRLLPGGLLAMAVLSEVGAGPGRFRVPPGELTTAFGGLETLVDGESGGMAWILAQRAEGQLSKS